MKAVIILSGGVDSTTLLYDIIDDFDEVLALTFNYNQKHSKEIEFAKRTCQKLGIEQKIIDLPILGEIAPSSLTRENIEVPEGHYEDENMKQTVVPNRNMVMLSLATSYAIGKKAHYLFYGAHAGDHTIYPDCRKEFVDAMKGAIKLSDWTEIRLRTPFIKMNKGDIVELGKELGVDYSLTWTCYKGEKKACGKCGSCIERLEAFKQAKMEDTIEYD